MTLAFLLSITLVTITFFFTIGYRSLTVFDLFI